MSLLKKLGALVGAISIGFGSVEVVEVLPSKVVPYNPSIKIAVVIDKKKFFHFLPQLLNSLNSYLIYRDGNYQFKVFDISQLPKALAYSPYILYYATNRGELQQLLPPPSPTPPTQPTYPEESGESPSPPPSTPPATPNYLVDRNHLFFIPTLSKRGGGVTARNLYYGGLQFWKQVLYLHQLEQPAPTAIVTQTGNTPQLLTSYETQLHPEAQVYTYPLIPSYWQLRDKNIYINLGGVRTAQFLSTLTAKLVTNVRRPQLPVKVVLGSQLSYSPRVIDLTQPRDREKLIIANSLQNLPDRLLDITQLIGGDLRYNWLGYTSATLLNGIYNFKVGNPIGQLQDFQLPIVGNQVQYQTKLYQIVDRGFAEVVPPSPQTLQFPQPTAGPAAGPTGEPQPAGTSATSPSPQPTDGEVAPIPFSPQSESSQPSAPLQQPGDSTGSQPTQNSTSPVQVIEEEGGQFPH